jgi:hypothetical protein
MAGRFLRIQLVVVALACAIATPAGARSELIRSTYSAPFVLSPGDALRYGLNGPVVGPLLAGQHVVWGEHGANGVWRVAEARRAGASRPGRTTTLGEEHPGAFGLDLSASPYRVAASLLRNCWQAPCPTIVGKLETWRYGESPTTLVRCPGAGCTARDCTPTDLKVVVSGDTVVYSGACNRGAIVARDLSPGGDPSPRTIAMDASLVRAAGHFVELRFWGGSDRLSVYDLTGRTKPYTVDGTFFGDVQADGKLGYLTVNGNGLGLASPAHPEGRMVVEPCYWNEPCTNWIESPRYYDGIRLAGDRFAMGLGAGDDARAARFEIRRLDGSVMKVGYADDVVGDFDFDGERVTFMTQPCQTTAIVVWDIREARPPRQSDANCPAARAASAKASLRDPKRLRLRLSCPKKARLGCIGSIHLVIFGGGHYAALGTRGYSVPYDRSPTASISLDANARRFLAQHRHAKLFAASAPVSRDDYDPRAGDRVRYDEIEIRRTGG